MRLLGRIGPLSVEILVDSGSTHNFLDPLVVKAAKLSVQKDVGLQVKVANGARVMSHGKCEETVTIQGSKFVIPFHILELGGCDVVLGIQWLKTLGSIQWNFNNMSLQFERDGSKLLLQGLMSDQLQVEDGANLLKSSFISQQGWLCQLVAVEEQREGMAVLEEVANLLQQFAAVFEEPVGLPPPRVFDHQIVLKEGTPPVSVRPYRYPHYQKTEIEKIVKDLLTHGVIRPSQSPFSSPVLLVKKADGTWRMCMDYRALNQATVKDKFPIPVIDELLDELYGARYFSKLDLRSGYHQIRVREEDIPKTAFRTHEGHYEFLVMPFGLTNAPATFQGLMNRVFKPFLRKFVLVFFYDILVYSRDLEQHLQHLWTVLSVLQQNSLFAKKSKCRFGVKEVDYLGHIISGEGVKADPTKISAMMEWPVPKSVKGLRGFLGLTGYYRKFIRVYGSIAAPLTLLLKKNSFEWNAEAERAFLQLKHAVAHPPVLRLPYFSQEFSIECDASGIGLGAVLMQNSQPIAYFSKALKGKALLLSTYEKEFLALVSAVGKWRPYLLGQPFKIRTDQQALKHLLEQKIATEAQHKWISKLMGYDFKVEYKKGRDNKVVDALSRKMEENSAVLALISFPTPVWLTELKQSYSESSHFTQLVESLEKGDLVSGNFSLQQGILLRKGKMLIVPGSSFQRKVLQYIHSSPEAGHVGYHKTLHKAKLDFYWPGMRKDIRRLVKECQVCQVNKSDNAFPAGLLQPLPIPQTPWLDIAMDFIEGLPPSNGRTVIFTVVDRLTKFDHFFSLSHPYTAARVAEVFFSGVFKLHGLPRTIVSDRDVVFTSLFWQELFKAQGTTLAMSSAYHPQSDGQAETLNKAVEAYLRAYSGSKPKSWSTWLPMAEWHYNTSVHSSTGISPFQALYGMPPPRLLSYVAGTTANEAVDQHLKSLEQILSLLKENLRKAQSRMKWFADKKRSDRSFVQGDWVFLKLQPYRQKSVAMRHNMKLAPRYYGPFQVIQKIGTVAYKLELPSTSKIHPVFHVSCLKKKLGDQISPLPTLPPVDEEGAVQPEPEQVLKRRMKKVGDHAATEVLVKWVGAAVEDSSWELLYKLKTAYPHLVGSVL